MVVRLKLALNQSEYSALLKMSRTELRNPADQIRYILRLELDRLGLLPQDESISVDKGIDHVPTNQV